MAMDPLPGSPSPAPQGIQIVKVTSYSAFILSVTEAQLGPIKGIELGFIEPAGYKHGFFCTPQTIADLRLGMAAAGYSGLETVTP